MTSGVKCSMQRFDAAVEPTMLNVCAIVWSAVSVSDAPVTVFGVLAWFMGALAVVSFCVPHKLIDL